MPGAIRQNRERGLGRVPALAKAHDKPLTIHQRRCPRNRVSRTCVPNGVWERGEMDSAVDQRQGLWSANLAPGGARMRNPGGIARNTVALGHARNRVSRTCVPERSLGTRAMAYRWSSAFRRRNRLKPGVQPAPVSPRLVRPIRPHPCCGAPSPLRSVTQFHPRATTADSQRSNRITAA